MGILVVTKVFGGFSSRPKLLATMMGRLVKKWRTWSSRNLYRNFQETLFNNDDNILEKNVKVVDKFKENSEYLFRIGLTFIQEL